MSLFFLNSRERQNGLTFHHQPGLCDTGDANILNSKQENVTMKNTIRDLNVILLDETSWKQKLNAA